MRELEGELSAFAAVAEALGFKVDRLWEAATALDDVKYHAARFILDVPARPRR
jgi:hypothetical protein